jgi:hypothetical protein
VRFNDRTCQQQLQQFVKLLNDGPSMEPEAITAQVEEWGISIGDDALWDTLAEEANNVGRNYQFFKKYKISGGKIDSKPILLRDVNLIRQLKNRATYQFTLRRHSYHPADSEGCNGLFTHGEFWGNDDYSYLATFTNNRLKTVETFPEWYLEKDV